MVLELRRSRLARSRRYGGGRAEKASPVSHWFGTKGKGFFLVLGALLLLQVAACGATPISTTTPQPTLDPRGSLRQAAARLLGLNSVAFTLEHQKGTTTILPGLEMSKAEGVVDIPNDFSLTVEAELTLIQSYVEISMVVIEQQAYMTDPLSGEWREVSLQLVPVNFTNLGETLADIVEAVDTPVLIGTERLNGRDTHRIRGKILSQDLSGLVPNAGTDFEVVLDVWLEQSNGMLLQALISGKVVPTDIPDALRLLTLDDFDVPVDIKRPE